MNKGHSPSPHQRLIEQLTAKESILKCREVTEYYDLKKLPAEIMQAIHEHGYLEYYLSAPKVLVSVPEGQDPKEYILNMIKRFSEGNQIKSMRV